MFGYFITRSRLIVTSASLYYIPGVSVRTLENGYSPTCFYGVMSHFLRYWVSRVQVATISAFSATNVARSYEHQCIDLTGGRPYFSNSSTPRSTAVLHALASCLAGSCDTVLTRSTVPVVDRAERRKPTPEGGEGGPVLCMSPKTRSRG